MKLKIAVLICIAILFQSVHSDSSRRKARAMTKAEKQGYGVMKKNYKQMTTKNFRSDVSMQLIDADGKTQTRHLKRLSKTDDKDQEKYLLIFTDPPAVRDTALLMIEHAERDDDIWFYFPAIKKIKRLSGANMAASYMGTEFTYKDMKREKISPKLNRYVYIRTEKLNSVYHRVIKAYPVSEEEKAEQGYHHRILWIRTDNHLATRIEFYDKEGDYLKKLEAEDMQEIGDSGKSRYLKMTMTNKKGVKTIITFNMMRINKEDPDDKFFTKTFITRKR